MGELAGYSEILHCKHDLPGAHLIYLSWAVMHCDNTLF